MKLHDSRTDPNGANAAVDYTYDPVYHRVAMMTDGTGTTTYSYHPVNGSAAPLGDGRLATADGPLANDTIAYSYDEYGRVKTRSINGAANNVTRVYDALGRVQSETNAVAAFSYGYVGNTGRLGTVSTPQGLGTSYNYWPHAAGGADGNRNYRLSSIVHYREDSVTAEIRLAARYDYRYAVAGNITQWDQSWEAHPAAGPALSLRDSLGYDRADQLTGTIKQKTGSGSPLVERTAWRYDAAANREVEQKSERQEDGSYATKLSVASHNALNQMTSRTGGSGALEVEGTVSKPATVRIAINGGAGSGPSAFYPRGDGTYGFRGTAVAQAGANALAVTATDAAGGTTTVQTTVTTSGAAIPAISYDIAGNELSDGTRTYRWDAASRLVQIDYPGVGNRTEFTYDGLGRRVRIKEYEGDGAQDERRFVWEGLSLAERRDASDALQRRYYPQGWVGGTAAAPGAADRNFYRRDHLGSVREVVNLAQGLVLRQGFDLWGRREPLYVAGEDAWSDSGYTGHYQHLRSGLALALYRGYSAELGRWLSRDPLGVHTLRVGLHRRIPEVTIGMAELLPEGPNLYKYANGNPSSNTDPTGLACGSGWTDKYIPDKVGGKFDFKSACEGHDKCYSTCGEKKKSCDDRFLEDMMSYCEDNFAGNQQCFRAAQAYYGAVREFGDGPYKAAQKCCKK